MANKAVTRVRKVTMYEGSCIVCDATFESAKQWTRYCGAECRNVGALLSTWQKKLAKEGKTPTLAAMNKILRAIDGDDEEKAA